ncbi:hypothetical protein M231_07771 [Tremella mesenterica]|uniref:Uncharacterized protein n=1 Tax=Tremella mesenterica TaxID=5217 RepID=A0A4Q1B8C4_TREME|nr:hypothetical protein M231_07771 [Tremella mesenterica]
MSPLIALRAFDDSINSNSSVDGVSVVKIIEYVVIGIVVLSLLALGYMGWRHRYNLKLLGEAIAHRKEKHALAHGRRTKDVQ